MSLPERVEMSRQQWKWMQDLLGRYDLKTIERAIAALEAPNPPEMAPAAPESSKPVEAVLGDPLGLQGVPEAKVLDLGGRELSWQVPAQELTVAHWLELHDREVITDEELRRQLGLPMLAEGPVDSRLLAGVRNGNWRRPAHLVARLGFGVGWRLLGLPLALWAMGTAGWHLTAFAALGASLWLIFMGLRGAWRQLDWLGALWRYTAALVVLYLASWLPFAVMSLAVAGAIGFGLAVEGVLVVWLGEQKS